MVAIAVSWPWPVAGRLNAKRSGAGEHDQSISSSFPCDCVQTLGNERWPSGCVAAPACRNGTAGRRGCRLPDSPRRSRAPRSSSAGSSGAPQRSRGKVESSLMARKKIALIGAGNDRRHARPPRGDARNWATSSCSTSSRACRRARRSISSQCGPVDGFDAKLKGTNDYADIAGRRRDASSPPASPASRA